MITPVALIVGKAGNKYSKRISQWSDKAYSQPAPAVQPVRNFETVATAAARRRCRIALPVIRVGEGDATGDVSEVAVAAIPIRGRTVAK